MAQPQNGGAPCPTSLIKTELCPVNCRVQWVNSGPCQDGAQTQTGKIVNQSFNGGAQCPENLTRITSCNYSDPISPDGIDPIKGLDISYDPNTPVSVTSTNYNINNTSPVSSLSSTINSGTGVIIKGDGKTDVNIGNSSSDITF